MTSRGAVDGEAGARLAQRLQQLRNGSAGSYPATEPALGWAHPYGVAYGGMTGGDQIEQVPGVDVAWSASQNAYRLVELQAKMNLERQPYALISSNGQPTRIEDHVNPEGNHGSWVDWNMNMTFSNGEGFFFAGSPTTRPSTSSSWVCSRTTRIACGPFSRSTSSTSSATRGTS